MASNPADVLTRFAHAIAGSPRTSPLSLRMCQACVSILGVDGGVFTLAYAEAERVTVCSTDDWAAQLDDLQEVVGEGPSFTAYHERVMQAMTIDDTDDHRWPLFSQAARPLLAPCAIYALPIKPGPQTMGVATFYQRRRSPLLARPAECQLLVDAVGITLVKDPEILDDGHAKADSWNSRARVHQATGMVMAQLSLAPTDGLALIRAHAYAHSVSMSTISDDIIARRLDFRTADQAPGNGSA